MKTRIKNLFSAHVLIACICFCLILAETARGQSGTYNGFYWQKTANTAAIGGYSGTNTALIIPGAIPYGGSNLLVTSIAGHGFYVNLSLTSVTIPDSVTDIGLDAFGSCLSLTNVVLGSGVIDIDSGAFYFCDKLTAINIPNGTTSIGDSAFQSCNSLTSIGLPDTVTNIGSSAFSGCGATNVVTVGSGLINIGAAAFYDCFRLSGYTVDPENPSYSSPGGALFDKNQTTLIAFPGGGGGSYAIPGTVTNIGNGAFAGALNLTSVTIPDSVVSIDTNAFWYCLSLTSIIIPDSVTKIETQAFIQCVNLASVTIGSGVTNIGENTFLYCDNLQSIYFRGNAPATDSTAFSGITNVIAYFLPGNMSWGAFSRNTGLPVVWWMPQIQTGSSSFGVKTNQFGFNINWTSGQTITIEACTNLFSPDWEPLQTNTLAANSLYFSDPQSTNYPARYYCIVSP